MKKNTRLYRRLRVLKATIELRLNYMERPGADDKEDELASDIALMEDMDKLSRLIDPEHSHYEGEN